MKRLFPILILLCAFPALAQLRTITLTFTNIPTNGCTVEIVGTTVRWTNAPLNNTAWIQTNGIAGSATNLVRRLGAQWPQYRAQLTNGTNVILSGNLVTLGITGNYGFLTTNTLANNTNRWLLDLPFAYMFETNRTNSADELIDGISKYARTNAFTANAQAMVNFVGITNQQTLTRKALTAPYITTGTNDGTLTTNSTGWSGTNLIAKVVDLTSGTARYFVFTNGYWVHATNANLTTARIDTLTVWTSATITNLSAPGTGANSQRIGSSASASGASAIALGVSALATNTDSIAIGTSASSYTQNGIAIGGGAYTDTTGLQGIAIGVEAWATGTNAIAVGASTVATHRNSVAIGASAATTETNQVRLGTATEAVSIPGRLDATNRVKLGDVVGSSHISGHFSFTVGTYGSMVGGSNNAVALSTNDITALSGHAAEANLNGLRLTWSAGDSQPRARIYNNTATNITLIHESGFMTDDTNRLWMANQSDMIIKGYGAAEFQWMSDRERWVLQWPQPITATATNAQPPSATLTNLAGTGALTNQIAGANIALTTNSGITTISTTTNLTNRIVSATNVVYALNTFLLSTNGNALGVSNVVVHPLMGQMVELYATNSLTWTNFTGMLDNTAGSVSLRVTPQLINRTNLWGLGKFHGVNVTTNDNSTLWTTFTNGNTYVVTFNWWGTNILATCIRTSQ